MTVSSPKASKRSGVGRMDLSIMNPDFCSISPSHAYGDQFFPDLTDASIYASSPNTLQSYDQEKADMQITLGGPTCTTCTPNSSSLSDDFDLKAQYEASRDFMIPFNVPALTSGNSTMMTAVGADGQDCGSWNVKSEGKFLRNSENDQSEFGPTLAELNFELLDEIDNYISVDMLNSQALQETPGLSKGDKFVPPGNSYTEMTRVTDDVTNGKTLMKSLNSTNLKNNSQRMDYSDGGEIVVKTEPHDIDFAHAGYSGVTTNTQIPKTQATQSTSSGNGVHFPNQNNSTLQKLLSSSTSQSRGKSEAILAQMLKRSSDVASTSKTQTQTRKRTGSVAGLESFNEKWEDIKQFIQGQSDSQGNATVTERKGRKRVDSASSVLTLTSNEDMESYQGDSDTDQNDFDESLSDSDLEGGCDLSSLDPSESLVGRSKEKQYFWQYNVQSKGPKGTRVHFDMEEDPHVLRIFEDPVFDPATSNVAGVGVTIKHGGKARKGDGNDIVPNPRKLCQIGLQLRKIARHINDFAPVSELPSPMRSKKRKEKNKLASRACRLKKKAQHEAHKVKLYGLEKEHRQLLSVLRLVQLELVDRVKNKSANGQAVPMSERLEQLMKENLSTMIAGNTTDFVNSVVRQVEAGDPTGGIEVKATRSYPKELHN